MVEKCGGIQPVEDEVGEGGGKEGGDGLFERESKSKLFERGGISFTFYCLNEKKLIERG